MVYSKRKEFVAKGSKLFPFRVETKGRQSTLRRVASAESVPITLRWHYISIAFGFAFEPARDKTYNKTFVTSKDLDQPVHPSSMAMVLVYPS